ncbi:DNA methyltransferase [Thiopseudomonas denitrificans]
MPKLETSSMDDATRVLDLFDTGGRTLGAQLAERMTNHCKIIVGDARRILQEIPEGHFNCVVTSPPYWGLRDYGINGQIGAETTVDDYIADLVRLFREVRRTLSDDGTLWLNIGDSYTSGGGLGGTLTPRTRGVRWTTAPRRQRV